MTSSAVATPPRPTSAPMRSPELLSGPLRSRRAVVLLVLTLLMPGAAQVLAGDRRMGRAGLRVWLGVITAAVLVAVIALLDRRLAFSLATSSWVLLLLAIALVLGALAWPVYFADAWRLGRPSLQPVSGRRGVAVLAALLVLMTSGPMAYAARQVWVGRDVLAGVFGGGTASAAHDGRYNVLLLGGDAGKDRVGTRPDSMTLVSVDAKTGQSVMFSFPRNMENIPFPVDSPMHRALPHGFDCGDVCLLNAVYSYAAEHKGIYPPSVKDPGAQATKDAISAISGLKVDYYVLIDLQGFQDMVNAMGGLTINVTKKVPIGGGTSPIKGYIPVGRHKLDGYHALWFARSRTGASDYERMTRQRCTMTAMLAQMDPQTVLLKFQGIAQASAKVVSTDIPQSELGSLTDLALKARSQKVTSVQFVPPLIRPAHPDFALIRSTVRAALADPAAVKGRAKKHPAASPSTAATSGGSTAGSTATSGGGASAAPVDAKSVCTAG